MKTERRNWKRTMVLTVVIIALLTVSVFFAVFKYQHHIIYRPYNAALQTVAYLSGEYGCESNIAAAVAVTKPKKLNVYHDVFGDDRYTEVIKRDDSMLVVAITFEDEPDVSYVFTAKAGNIQDIIHRDRLVMVQVTEDYDGHEFLHADEFMWYGE